MTLHRICIGLALLLGGCATAPSWRIVDADTLALGGLRYRLWGVDAPELATPEGKAARAAVLALADGRPIRCTPVPGARDRYGRIVARCTVGGVDLARWLVNHGHARPMCRYGGAEYGDCPINQRN